MRERAPFHGKVPSNSNINLKTIQIKKMCSQQKWNLWLFKDLPHTLPLSCSYGKLLMEDGAFNITRRVEWFFFLPFFEKREAHWWATLNNAWLSKILQSFLGSFYFKEISVMGCEQSLSVNKLRERKQKQGVSREDAWLGARVWFYSSFLCAFWKK